MKFQIENYENMTVEEKLAALEAYEPDMSGFVAKSAFDKTASELAAAKKSIREKMTEDEAKQSDKLVQDMTDKYIKEIDGVTAAKTKEIMEI